MIDLVKICGDAFETGECIALLPSQGIFSTDGCFLQDSIYFAHNRSLSGLDIILESINHKTNEILQNSLFNDENNRTSLREFTSTLTGISKVNFLHSDLAIVKFDSKLNVRKNHEADLKLLNWLSNKVFSSLDFLRFIHCDLAISDKLPLVPGYWDSSNGYMGCIILTPNGDDEIISGKRMGGEANFGLGIGLEKIDAENYLSHKMIQLFSDDNTENNYEVLKIIRHALKLYSKAMYCNNETMKFIICIAIFEYLGTGSKYTAFKKIRPKLQAHLAENKKEYDNLTDFFQKITSKKINGKNIGYRTRIIHEGEFIENIIPDEFDRRVIFGQLSACIVPESVTHSLALPLGIYTDIFCTFATTLVALRMKKSLAGA